MINRWHPDSGRCIIPFQEFRDIHFTGDGWRAIFILISFFSWVFEKRFHWNSSSSKLEKLKLETRASKLNSQKLWASRIKFRVETVNLHVPLSSAVAGYHDSDNNTLHFSFKCRSYYCYGNIHVLNPKIDSDKDAHQWLGSFWHHKIIEASMHVEWL